MNKLKGSMVYLSGQIDRISEEEATHWRNYLTPIFKNLGVGVLDPCNKPITGAIEDQNARDIRKAHIKAGRFEEATKMMKEIARVDLRMVDKADLLVVYLNMDTFHCGTIHELIIGLQQNKPCLVVIKQGKVNMPDWLLGIMPHRYIFSTFIDMMEYVTDIDSGRIEANEKYWRFFDNKKIWE